MRVLIPGGSGLIGRALAAELAAGGHEVLILSRDPARLAGLPQGVRALAWDGRTSAGWGELAEGAGAIVNLAGAGIGDKRWTATRKILVRDSRVYAGQAVTQAVTEARVKPGVVIQSCAVGYYGPRGDEELGEDALPGRDFLAEVCLDWEASTAGVEAQGVRRVVLRSGVVLAREGGALPPMARPFRFFVGGPVGSGRQWLSWIHLADEVGAIRFLMERADAAGPFNLAAPQPLRNRDFSQALGRAMGRPSAFPAPAFLLKLLFGELSMMVLEGQRVLPRRLEALGYRFKFPEAAAALQNLYPR